MQQVNDSVGIQQSQVWQTNTGIIETAEGVILVDPGILADELVALKESLGDKVIVAGFSTHYHWDHILWPTAFGVVPRFASEETCELVDSRRDRVIRTLDDFEQHLAEQYQLGPQWNRDMFFTLQPMTLGLGEIAGVTCELVAIPGHADGQVALVLPDYDVAFVADTLSDIEVPSLASGAGQWERYMETLDHLQGVIDRVSWIIPGHGSVADRAEAQRRLDADRRYLEYLPKAVSAMADEPDAEIAATILIDLGETRIDEELSQQMHVENVRMMREQVSA